MPQAGHVAARCSPRSRSALVAATPRCERPRPRGLLRRRSAGPARRARTSTRWARRRSGRCASSSPGRAVDPSPAHRRLRLVVGRRRWSASAARNGVATLPFVYQHAGLGARSSTATTASAARVPLVTRRRARGRSPPGAGSSPPPSTATGRTASSGPLNPALPELPIRDWQLWNEQNSPSFWKPKPNVKAYAKLLDAAHDAIKRERPRCRRSMLGGMFGTPLGGPQARRSPPGTSSPSSTASRAPSATSTASRRIPTRRSSSTSARRSSCFATR